MQSPHEVVLYSLAAQAYAAGFAVHGELNLPLETYTSRLICIVKKHSDEPPSPEGSLAVFGWLHTNDLYLSIACAHSSETAWERFWTLYQKHVRAVANSVSLTRAEASDLADSILAHLFLLDGLGRSRIGTYEGLSPLTIWLRSVIDHQARKEGERKCNHFERLADLPDIADYTATDKVEDELRADTYESLIKDSLVEARESLGERERVLLALRYDRALQRTEIAQLAGVHPSTVTRQLRQTRETLRDRIISTLSTKHRLSSLAIEECVEDILSNPEYSLLS